MITGGNNKLANVPTVTGLSNVDADVVTSSSVDTETLTLNGVDVGAQIAQIPINTAAIAGLQQVTTGQSYVSVGDTTTFSNNVTLTTGKTMTADNFVGLASNASQVTVVTNNTSSTYYPVFAGGTGSGQKQLQFDPNTTPLSYTPDSSILRMGSIETTNNSNVNNLFMGSKNTATTFMTYGPGLPALTTGDYNVIMGGLIGSSLAGGSNNFALGHNAFDANINGCNNCIMGHRAALALGASGNFYTWYNVAIGDTSLTNANDVAESTCIGWGTGNSMLNGNLKCTCIGAAADCADGLSYATSIGSGVTVTTSNTVKIGRAADTTIFDGTVTNTIAQPAASDSSTKIPTTAWVQSAISGAAPANMVTTDTNQTITAEKTFSQFMKFTKAGGDVVIGQNITAEFGFNNFTSSGSYKFSANTALAVPQTIMNLSSGVSEGLVSITGNIELTSRAGGTAATISNSSTGILTIQNNATSGSTQIINENASGVAKTNLLFSTAKQIVGGDGTDFQLVLAGDATTTATKTMRIFSNSTDHFIDCGTSYLGGTTSLTMRSGAGVGRARFTNFGVELNGLTTNFYGRIDGFDYTAAPPGSPGQPIGFIATYNETPVTFTSGTAFNYTTVLPLLGPGVWQVNGTLALNRGTGTFATTSFMRAFVTTATNFNFYPNTNGGVRQAIPATTTVDVHIMPFNSILNNVSALTIRPAIQGQISMTVGTALKSLHVVFVKIA